MEGLRDNWHDLARQARRYLEVLRDGGILYVEGTLDLPQHKAGRPAGQQPQQPSALPAETREMLKAALQDPYANLKPPPGRQAAPAAKQTSAAGSSAAKGKSAVELHDPAEGAKRIAAAKSIKEIRTLVTGCYMCSLAAGRTNVVPGEGNAGADLVFVGEAPGYHEDQQGKPFVGRAGSLLTDMIRAMGMEREDVFICNILKCRPPANRDPQPAEMAACEPYLKRQLALIRPKVICALGRIAIQSLLRDTTPISKLRGKWRTYEGIPLMPTFHPAYLLRNNSQKRNVWEDLQAIMAKLEELK